MRLGLIADVHADPRALEDALRGLDSHGVDLILCAGDLVGYGNEPDAAVALLRDRGIPCVRGNHDRWALERRQVLGPRGWKPAVLRDDTWEFLEALPASDTEYVTPYRPFPASVERFLAASDADVLILGHTHIPMIGRGPCGTVINPGSVLRVPGVPTSNSFAVVDSEVLTVRLFDIRTGREIRRDPIVLVEQ